MGMVALAERDMALMRRTSEGSFYNLFESLLLWKRDRSKGTIVRNMNLLRRITRNDGTPCIYVNRTGVSEEEIDWFAFMVKEGRAAAEGCCIVVEDTDGDETFPPDTPHWIQMLWLWDQMGDLAVACVGLFLTRKEEKKLPREIREDEPKIMRIWKVTGRFFLHGDYQEAWRNDPNSSGGFVPYFWGTKPEDDGKKIRGMIRGFRGTMPSADRSCTWMRVECESCVVNIDPSVRQWIPDHPTPYRVWEGTHREYREQSSQVIQDSDWIGAFADSVVS